MSNPPKRSPLRRWAFLAGLIWGWWREVGDLGGTRWTLFMLLVTQARWQGRWFVRQISFHFALFLVGNHGNRRIRQVVRPHVPRINNGNWGTEEEWASRSFSPPLFVILNLPYSRPSPSSCWSCLHWSEWLHSSSSPHSTVSRFFPFFNDLSLPSISSFSVMKIIFIFSYLLSWIVFFVSANLTRASISASMGASSDLLHLFSHSFPPCLLWSIYFSLFFSLFFLNAFLIHSGPHPCLSWLNKEKGGCKSSPPPSPFTLSEIIV